MTRNIPRITRTTQPIAFCGRFALRDLPFAGLYFAITAMVSPRNAAAMQECRDGHVLFVISGRAGDFCAL
jgi:hypothetical protein